jgi:hypothetical protein
MQEEQIRAVFVNSLGNHSKVYLGSNYKDRLRKIQNLLGGMLEVVPEFFYSQKLRSLGLSLLVNERARLLLRKDKVKFALNMASYNLLDRCSGVYGPLIITKFDDDGDTVSLTEDDLNEIISLLHDKNFIFKK